MPVLDFPCQSISWQNSRMPPQPLIVFFLSHEVQNGSFFFSDANGSRGLLLHTFSSVRQGQHISKHVLQWTYTRYNHTGNFISLFSPRSLKGCLHFSNCRTQLGPLKRSGPAVISNGSFRVRTWPLCLNGMVIVRTITASETVCRGELTGWESHGKNKTNVLKKLQMYILLFQST